MKNYPFSALLLLLLLFACQQDDPNELKAFYYPFENFENGAVMEFRPVKIPEMGKEYWYVKSFQENDHRYLITQVFNEDLELQQYKKEEYVDNGILSREVRILRSRADSTPLIPITIRQNGVFPFYFQDSLTRYIYDLSWLDPVDGMEYRITRNRRLTHREDRMFLGKLRPSWHAVTLEELETIDEGSTLSTWGGEEWFAEDLGLVYFKKQITPEFAREYYLHQKFDAQDFFREVGELKVVR